MNYLDLLVKHWSFVTKPGAAVVGLMSCCDITTVTACVFSVGLAYDCLTWSVRLVLSPFGNKYGLEQWQQKRVLR
jgi:hypothetical protein